MDEHRLGEFAATEFPERARLRRAVMEAVVEKGLSQVDLEEVLNRAGVSRVAFDREFGGHEECCIRIYRANVAEFDRIVFGAADRERPWRDRLRAAAYAAARYVRDRPLETGFDMIQMLASGDEALAFRDRYVERIIDLIDEGRQETEDPDSLTRATAIGVFGSIYELLQKDLQGGRGTDSAESLVPQLMYLAVRPYLGQAAAARELTIPAPPEHGEALR